MRKVEKNSYLPIKRKLDRYYASKDPICSPEPEFFEEDLKLTEQIRQKKSFNRIFKLILVVLFITTFIVTMIIFCGTASG